MFWGMLGGFGGAEVEVDSDSEWFVVRTEDDAGTDGTTATIETDGALEDIKECLDLEAIKDLDEVGGHDLIPLVPLVPAHHEAEDANDAEDEEEGCPEVAPSPVKTWAEVVKSPALVAQSPPLRPSREVPEFDLDEAPKPSFVLGDGPCEPSEKDLATAKYSRRCKDRSFGHTMRARQARPVQGGVWKMDPASPVTQKGARKVSAGELVADLQAGGLEVVGPMRFAQASELADRLGGTVKVCKGKEGRDELLGGAQLSVVELQAEDGIRKYLVKEELPKALRSRRVRSGKCPAAAPAAAPEWRSVSLAKHKKGEFRAAVREALHE